MNKKVEILKILEPLLSTFPGAPSNKESYTLMIGALFIFELDSIQRGASRYLLFGGKFFNWSDFVNCVILEELEAQGYPSPEEAWKVFYLNVGSTDFSENELISGFIANHYEAVKGLPKDKVKELFIEKYIIEFKELLLKKLNYV